MKYHIGKNGPSICKAEKRACRYEQEQHFESFEKALEHHEKSLIDDGLQIFPVTETVATKGLSNLINSLAEAYPNKNLAPLEKVISIGKEVEKELEKSTKVDFDNVTIEDLENISQKTFELFNKLSTPSYKRKNLRVTGPHANILESVTEKLPMNAINRIVHPIDTTTVKINTLSFEGTHRHSGIVKTSERSVIKYSDLNEGEFITDHYSFELNEMDGFRVNKILKKFNRIESGVSIQFYKRYLNNKDYVNLLEKEIINIEDEINPGKSNDFLLLHPDAEEKFAPYSVTEDYWVGVKPKGTKSLFTKTKEEHKIYTKDNKSFNSSNVSKIETKKQVHNMHTISLKKDASESIVLHELSHALQSYGIPGEKEIFKEIAQKGKLTSNEQFKYYDSFPSEYMGEERGKELFTVATESIFYPHKGNPELYINDNKNKQKIRQWVLGVWGLYSH